MSTPSLLPQRLRELRRERGYSLQQVADVVGISTSFLSMVESGKSDLTVGRLIRLVDFYGVHLTDLLPPSPPDPVVVRAGERKHLQHSSEEGVDAFLLAPDLNGAMMPTLNVISPSGGYVEHAVHKGEEFVLVLTGRVELSFEGTDPIVLEPGDSAYFEAHRPHAYRNLDAAEARFLAVVTPPSL